MQMSKPLSLIQVLSNLFADHTRATFTVVVREEGVPPDVIRRWASLPVDAADALCQYSVVLSRNIMGETEVKSLWSDLLGPI